MKDCEEGEKGEMCGGGREGREAEASGHNGLGERLAFLLTHVPSRHHRVRAPPATAGVGGVAWTSLQGGNVSRITVAER